MSYFAEKGKGEPAILRDPACAGSSVADSSSHLDTVRQMDSQEEAQGDTAMMELAAEQRLWRQEQGLDGAAETQVVHVKKLEMWGKETWGHP